MDARTTGGGGGFWGGGTTAGRGPRGTSEAPRGRGLGVALFFVAVLPGNISQLLTHRTPSAWTPTSPRAVRLLFQPVFVVWALWSTGAWMAWRRRRDR